jgi:hypothetical protein
MRRHSTEKDLREEKQNDYYEIFRRSPLTFRGNAWKHCGMRVFLAAFPSEKAELSESQQNDAHSSQERYQA